jgi:hypothetical protein
MSGNMTTYECCHVPLSEVGTGRGITDPQRRDQGTHSQSNDILMTTLNVM